MAGGTDGDGTIFEITPAGTLTTVLNLNGIDGAALSRRDWHREPMETFTGHSGNQQLRLWHHF